MTARPQQGAFFNGKLTNKFVRAAKEPGHYHDSSGLGLMLRVTRKNSQQWVQRVMFGGRRLELGLGSPPVVTLDQAREQALENKRLLHNGKNPLDLKAAKAAVPTFEEAARVAVVELSVGKAPKYGQSFISALALHAFPQMGGTKIDCLTGRAIKDVLTALIIEKPETGKKVKDNINQVLKWALAKEYITTDPMRIANESLPKVVKSLKHHASLPYREVNGLLDTVRQTEANPLTKLGLEFLILTATRSGETRGAQMEEIDIQKRLWTIPAERMKMTSDHIVPLSDRAIEILREAKSLGTGKGLIFPSPRGKMLSDVTWLKLVKEHGYSITIHGFRTSFRTWTQEMTTFSEEACELSLSHRTGNSVRRAYARSELLGERAPLMQAWTDYLKTPSDLHTKGN